MVDDSVVIDACPVLALGFGVVVKRAVDFVGSLILLALCGIPMLAVAPFIKLTSPGPAIYRQERVGLGGRRFNLLKFRTMRVDAEEATGPVWRRSTTRGERPSAPSCGVGALTNCRS